MDQGTAKLHEAVARIDERTGHILDGLEIHAKALAAHESRNREDFKEIHSRISDVDKRVSAVSRTQNWMLGIGTAGVFVLTAVVAFFRGIFGA